MHSNSTSMNKSELRKIYLSKRNEFSLKEIEQMSHSILENLKNMSIWENQNFHVFKSIPNKNEVQTSIILDYLFELNKTILVPKVIENHLISCQINELTEWAEGKFKVPEPLHCHEFPDNEIDVVFVPLLICDNEGNRIGYGGGFYDRFLANCTKKTLKIGLNFFPPISESIHKESFDIPLDYCVTPTEIVSFSSAS